MVVRFILRTRGLRLFVERAKLHEIADLVTHLLASQGYVCLDAEFEAHTRTLRLFIDHQNGVDIDACARVSTQLVESTDLDVLLPFEYNLEISSPGIERPIRTLQHFLDAKNEGCEVSVHLTEKFTNRRKGKGTITLIGPDQIISMTTTEGPWSFPWNMVLKATKVADWGKIQASPM